MVMFDRQPKDRIIGARVTKEEYDLIAEFAADLDTSISNIIIHSVAEYIAKRVTQQEQIMENEEEK